MIQQRITEKLKILSEQLNVEDRQKIEKELIKMNPSEKSQFDFSCGYSNRDEFFSVNFNFRITYPTNKPQDTIDFYSFFEQQMNIVNPIEKNLESVDESLDIMLDIDSEIETIIYPSMFIDDESGNFIAGIFSLKKYYK